MAKDRLFFLLSFAFLGIVAAFLFRTTDAPTPPPRVETQVNNMQAASEKALIEVLVAKEPLRTHEHLSPNNYTWEKIEPSAFTSSLIIKTPETEKLLTESLVAKDIPKDSKILRSDVFWPIDEKNQSESLSLSQGEKAVPFEISKRQGLLQFIKPGMFVDIAFTSTPDSRYGAMSFTLLRNIRVLAVTKDEQADIKLGGSNRPGSSPEVLLGMTPQEADVFYYAQASGELSLEFLNKPEQENNPLVNKLLQSESLGNFHSILITHMIHSLFPDTNIVITTIPNGYVASGKVSNAQKQEKILEVLAKLAPNGEKSVVNLMESDAPEEPKIEVKEELVPVEQSPLVLPTSPGRIAVLIDVAATYTSLQFLEPGKHVDIIFNSKPDLGFGAVSIILLKNIRVLGVRDLPNNNFFNKEQGSPPLAQVLLEMTPKEAEIFSYAQTVGIAYPGVSEANSPRIQDELVKRLLRSTSVEEFRSSLITYMVQSLFPNVNINIVTTAKGGFVVEGRVADPQKADKIMEIINKLAPADEKSIVNLMDVEPQQVLINVKVMEVSKHVTGSLGVNWQVLFTHDATTAALAAVFPPPAPLTPNFFASGDGMTSGNFTLSALVNMLEQDDGTKVLAQPNLTTTSGKTAHFFAGGEFPILIPQGGSLLGTVTVEFKKYGVLLDFTPFVDLNGLITMQIAPEISTIDRANAVILSGFVIPGLITRRTETTVKLWPGQSYAISGLLQDVVLEKNSNLYGLDRLPIIGPLFSSKSFEDQQTELIIIVTPFLLSTDRAAVCQERRDEPEPCELCGSFHDLCETIVQWEQ